MPPNSDPGATVEAEIVLPAHLHARPASQLVQAAARFSATIDIEYNGRVANARSILTVMSLNATAGTTITLRATGPDAPAAVSALTALLSES
jgi:phosphotransferase system HPr (HPr) family protein